jgi:hypothetical protein
MDGICRDTCRISASGIPAAIVLSPKMCRQTSPLSDVGFADRPARPVLARPAWRETLPFCASRGAASRVCRRTAGIPGGIERLFTPAEIREYLDYLARTKYLAPQEPELTLDDLDEGDDAKTAWRTR